MDLVQNHHITMILGTISEVRLYCCQYKRLYMGCVASFLPGPYCSLHFHFVAIIIEEEVMKNGWGVRLMYTLVWVHPLLWGEWKFNGVEMKKNGKSTCYISSHDTVYWVWPTGSSRDSTNTINVPAAAVVQTVC